MALEDETLMWWWCRYTEASYNNWAIYFLQNASTTGRRGSNTSGIQEETSKPAKSKVKHFRSKKSKEKPSGSQIRYDDNSSSSAYSKDKTNKQSASHTEEESWIDEGNAEAATVTGKYHMQLLISNLFFRNWTISNHTYEAVCVWFLQYCSHF